VLSQVWLVAFDRWACHRSCWMVVDSRFMRPVSKEAFLSMLSEFMGLPQ